MEDIKMQPTYKETEYKVKPTWGLAWGLLWRMWVLCIPLYILVAIFNAVG